MKQRAGQRIPGAFIDDDEYSDDEVGRKMRMDRMRQMRQDEEMADEDQDM
jgi:hypothetical protein